MLLTGVYGVTVKHFFVARRRDEFDARSGRILIKYLGLPAETLYPPPPRLALTGRIEARLLNDLIDSVDERVKLQQFTCSYCSGAFMT